MSVVASFQVTFGEGADSSALVKYEFDKKLNIDAAGEEVTQFSPGDNIFFLIHFDSSKLRIGNVRATHYGQIVKQNIVPRIRSQMLFFSAATDTVELDYIPSAEPEATWYGNVASQLKMIAQRQMGISGGELPAKCQVEYPVLFQGYKFISPELELAEGDSWPIDIEIIMEAA